MSQGFQVIILGSLMLTFQLVHGLFTEHVAQGVLLGLTWSSAAIELATYTGLSAIEMRLSTKPFSLLKIPYTEYAVIAVLISLGRGLTWVAYGNLSYPIVIAFKSSKMLVVMVSGTLILRKRFSTAQYSAAFLVMAGLYLISTVNLEVEDDLSRFNRAPQAVYISSFTGLLVAGTATVLEGVVSNLQERSLSCEHRSLAEMIFVTNGMGAMLLLVLAVLSGEMHMLAASVGRDAATPAWLLATVTLAYGCGRAPLPNNLLLMHYLAQICFASR